MPNDHSTRKPLLFGALLAALLLAFWGFRSSGQGEHRSDEAVLAAGDSTDTLLEADLPTPLARTEVRREPTAQPLPKPSAAQEEEAPTERVYPVRGTFVLEDCFGQELTRLDAHFEVITHFDHKDEREDLFVELRQGVFEFSVPDPSRFFVHEFALANREEALDVEQELTGPHDDRQLTLRAREQCEVRLEVVDATTHSHLSKIQLWRDYDLDGSPRIVPVVEECELVVGRATSPIILPEVEIDWSELNTYWVRAEGYAWGKVNVDHTHTGDYIARLGPGASLGVVVQGLERTRLRGQDTWLHLRDVEHDDVLAYAKLERSLAHRWDGLPPGAYQVTVDLGFYWDDPLLLGSAEADLSTSDEVSLVIEASPPELPFGPVQVSGTIRTHEFWREHGFSLGFHGLGETERWETPRLGVKFSELVAEEGDPELFHWSEELPCEGAWQVTVGHLGVHEDFEAGASGAQGIEITVPAPAELSILVKDAETGHTLPALGVWYAYKGKTRNMEIVWPRTEYDPESGRHQMAMPAGRALVRFSSEGYVDVEEELELSPGKHELSYELELCARVDFEFMEGTTAIPVSFFDVEVEATPLAGEGEISEVWFQGLVFTEPGPYRVKISGLAGYLEAETVVEVPSKGVVSHRVPLVRE